MAATIARTYAINDKTSHFGTNLAKVLFARIMFIKFISTRHQSVKKIWSLTAYIQLPQKVEYKQFGFIFFLTLW